MYRKYNQQRKQKQRIKSKHVHQLDDTSSSSSSDDEFVLSVGSDSENRHTDVMMLCNMNVEFQLDNGSTVNIMPQHLYEKLSGGFDCNVLNSTEVTLRMYNKRRLKPLGTRRFSVRNVKTKRKYNLEFHVVKVDNFRAILGIKAVEAMNLITVNRDSFATKSW